MNPTLPKSPQETAPRTGSPHRSGDSWSLLMGFVLLGLVLVSGYTLWQRAPLVDLQQKQSLVSNLRVELLKAQSAEKNALLAARSDSAHAYARQARAAVAAIELGKKDLVASQCLQNLSELEQSVAAQQSRATR